MWILSKYIRWERVKSKKKMTFIKYRIERISMGEIIILLQFLVKYRLKVLFVWWYDVRYFYKNYFIWIYKIYFGGIFMQLYHFGTCMKLFILLKVRCLSFLLFRHKFRIKGLYNIHSFCLFMIYIWYISWVTF